MLDVQATINNISYKASMGKELPTYKSVDLEKALSKPCFYLEFSPTIKYAISQWVSPKRTRSYPYARVYHTLAYSGKRVTLIPVIKDEGIEGERDYIQWDTISMMSLLQTYVILVYYVSAQKSRKPGKITKQKISQQYLLDKLNELSSYKCDALHWNLLQAKSIANLMKTALKKYDTISEQLKVRMHDSKTANTRISMIEADYNNFLQKSRENAKQAQHRESVSLQPKENVVTGDKATITIRNFLNGVYYLTADEARVKKGVIHLIEAKHTKTCGIPSKDDILDGVLKMILFTSLEDVTVEGKTYQHVSILKITNNTCIKQASLNYNAKKLLIALKKEAADNGFMLEIV